ncbi:hypothetical protein PR003_g23442 [Phytophthora rubi]|uniref:Uncharacterized protein n=1 Tax=Phytophthora rubi TaxID=129364 RepID=A0A6A4D6X0_9STRA|nr:hypothetical protein PR003_g23442 [Phytophthora rubi]
MSVGWDPKTHPTRQWILDHLDEYEDEENKLVELFVLGIASCVAMRVKRKKDAEAAETERKVKQQQRQHYELLRRQSSLHL